MHKPIQLARKTSIKQDIEKYGWLPPKKAELPLETRCIFMLTELIDLYTIRRKGKRISYAILSPLDLLVGNPPIR
jgi:hypothetical protein